MLFNDEQPLKSDSGIDVIEEGISISINEQHLSNAPLSKLVTEGGKAKLVNDEQSWKANSGILPIEEGNENVTFDNAVHLLKMYLPIDVIEEGISISFKEEHPSKTPFPSFFTDEGIVTFFNEVHLLNANCSIDVIDEGISTSVNELQPSNEYSEIVCKENGISILVKAEQPLNEKFPMMWNIDGNFSSSNEMQSLKNKLQITKIFE